MDVTAAVVLRHLPHDDPESASLVSGRYGDRTFDLSPLHRLDAELVKTGRAGAHPDHRNAAVVSLMWAGMPTT